MIDTSDAGANYPILPNVRYAAAGFYFGMFPNGTYAAGFYAIFSVG
jgi:hypothetical protein